MCVSALSSRPGLVVYHDNTTTRKPPNPPTHQGVEEAARLHVNADHVRGGLFVWGMGSVIGSDKTSCMGTALALLAPAGTLASFRDPGRRARQTPTHSSPSQLVHTATHHLEGAAAAGAHGGRGHLQGMMGWIGVR